MNFTANYGDDPNYVGARIKPLKFKQHTNEEVRPTEKENKGVRTLDQTSAGVPTAFASEVTDKDFEQATALWHLLAKQEGAQDRFVGNVAAHIAEVQRDWIRREAYGKYTCLGLGSDPSTWLSTQLIEVKSSHVFEGG